MPWGSCLKCRRPVVAAVESEPVEHTNAGAHRAPRCSLRGEAVTSLGATPVNDFAATLRAHTSAEAVGPFALNDAGLIRSFHGDTWQCFLDP